MRRRALGSSGISVGEIGYGCMGLTWAYGEPVDAAREADAVALIHRAVELGVTLFDTADMYGPFTNEELLGRALRGRRDRVAIATKCGLVVHDKTTYDVRRNARPEHITAACEASLRRLGTETIDLYQLHRVDPDVPVEESVGAMAELVTAGKVRAIGLSEVDVPTLERAVRVHPIASLQSELSLFERYVLAEILPWCEAHGVALIAYAPLGRGFLTGRLAKDAIMAGDFRATLPRFRGEAFERNQRLVEEVDAIAGRLGVTSGQAALAWVLAQGEGVIPIPGTKRVAYLEENVAAAGVRLSQEDLAALNAVEPATGARYANPAFGSQR
ncbi:MAG TPA: aldo/keto reductase [Candidatus Dormibacteraeota bacterium]|nr:aldo/keto reductase [Candidatus Dormibacteraeota bacterium]